MPTLSPLTESPSLDKLAYDKIKEAILTFKFLPDQILLEGELAAQLGISKTPVRDALMRLEKEGLVARIPYKGTYVSSLTNEDMANIFRIRIVLEGLAVRLASERLTPKDYQQLQDLVEKHAEALRKKDVAAASAINSDFHNLIIDVCENPRLRQMLYNLDDHLKRYRLLSISQGLRMDKAIHEHTAICEALIAHDADRAEQAMKAHLESAMNDLYNQDFSKLETQLAQSQTS